MCGINYGDVKLLRAVQSNIPLISTGDVKLLKAAQRSRLLSNVIVGVNITYSINVNQSEQSSKLNDLQSKLINGILSGNLTIFLRANAKLLNSSSLKMSSASKSQYYVASTNSIAYYGGAPTLMPTTSQGPKNSTRQNATLWNARNDAILNSKIFSKDKSSRILYNTVTVNGKIILGGCSSWLPFCASSTSLTSPSLSSQRQLSYINFVYLFNISSPAEINSCSNADNVEQIASSLCSTGLESTVANISCANHRWIVADCFIHNTYQKVMCVDCSNPCAGIEHSVFYNPCVVSNSTKGDESSIVIIDVGYNSTIVEGVQYWVLSFTAVTAIILLVSFILGGKNMRKRKKIGVQESRHAFHGSSSLVSSHILLLKPTFRDSSGFSNAWCRKILIADEGPNMFFPNFDNDVSFFESFSNSFFNGIFGMEYLTSDSLKTISDVVKYVLSRHAYFTWGRSECMMVCLTDGLYIIARVTSILLLSTLIILIDMPFNQNSTCNGSRSLPQCVKQKTLLSGRSFCAWLPGDSVLSGGDDQTRCIWTNPGLSYDLVALGIAASVILLRIIRCVGKFLLCPSRPCGKFNIKSAKVSHDERIHVALVADLDKFQLFDEFSDAFTQHIHMLRENGAIEEFNELIKNWESYNPAFLQYILDMELIEVDADTNKWEKMSGMNASYASFGRHRGTVEVIAKELLRVQQHVRLVSPIFSSISSDSNIFTANLMYQFFLDTIGMDSPAANVFASLISKQYFIEESRFRWKNSFKIACLVIMILTYEFGVFLVTAASAITQSQQLQLSFISIAVVLVFVDICVSEVAEILYYWYLLPMYIRTPLCNMQRMFSEICDTFKQSQSIDSMESDSRDAQYSNGLPEYSPYQLNGKETAGNFSVQKFQNPSLIIAKTFPGFAISKLISSHQKAFPFAVGTPRWPCNQPIFRRDCVGFTGLLYYYSTTLVLFFVSKLPTDIQDVLISLLPAGLCLCVAYFGKAISGQPIVGAVCATIIIIAVLFIFVASVAIISRRKSSSTISIEPLEEMPTHIGDDADQDARRQSSGVPNQDAEERDGEKALSRDSSSVVSEAKTQDSLENYIIAPLNIDFDDFEFDVSLADYVFPLEGVSVDESSRPVALAGAVAVTDNQL